LFEYNPIPGIQFEIEDESVCWHSFDQGYYSHVR
jgi:hypothetical protein